MNNNLEEKLKSLSNINEKLDNVDNFNNINEKLDNINESIDKLITDMDKKLNKLKNETINLLEKLN